MLKNFKPPRTKVKAKVKLISVPSTEADLILSDEINASLIEEGLTRALTSKQKHSETFLQEIITNTSIEPNLELDNSLLLPLTADDILERVVRLGDSSLVLDRAQIDKAIAPSMISVIAASTYDLVQSISSNPSVQAGTVLAAGAIVASAVAASGTDDVALPSTTGLVNGFSSTQSDTTPELSGQTGALNTITIITPKETLTTVANSLGIWKVDVVTSLEDGKNTIEVQAIDKAGMVAITTVDVVIDKNYVAPSIFFDPSDANINTDNQYLLTGKTAGLVAGTILKVIVTDKNGQSIGAIAVVNADGSFTATVDLTSLSAGQLTFTVKDDKATATFTDTANYTLDTVNLSPVVVDDLNKQGIEGEKSFSLDLLDGASDPEGDTLALNNLHFTVDGVSTSNNGKNLPNGVTITGNTLTIDPSLPWFDRIGGKQSQVITAEYEIIDNKGGVTKQTATITVLGVNDAPISINSEIITSENTVYTLSTTDIGFMDNTDRNSPNELLSFEIKKTPSNGQLFIDTNKDGIVSASEALKVGDTVTRVQIESGLLKYRPAQDQSGENFDFFDIQVKDNGGTENGGIDTSVNNGHITVHVNVDPSISTDETLVGTANDDRLTGHAGNDLILADGGTISNWSFEAWKTSNSNLTQRLSNNQGEWATQDANGTDSQVYAWVGKPLAAIEPSVQLVDSGSTNYATHSQNAQGRYYADTSRTDGNGGTGQESIEQTIQNTLKGEDYTLSIRYTTDSNSSTTPSSMKSGLTVSDFGLFWNGTQLTADSTTNLAGSWAEQIFTVKGTGTDLLKVQAWGDNGMGIGIDNINLVAANHGNDSISGGAGNDTIMGGAGNDTVATGAGNDVIVFSRLEGQGHDVITDFATGDRIVLTNLLDIAGASKNPSANNITSTENLTDLDLTGTQGVTWDDASKTLSFIWGGSVKLDGMSTSYADVETLINLNILELTPYDVYSVI